MKKKIRFGNDYPKICSTDIFVATIDWKDCGQNLLAEFVAKLKLPLSSVTNWDDLLKRMESYSWIKEKYIVIYSNEIPTIISKDLYRAIEQIVLSIYTYNNNGTNHKVYIVFPEKFRPFVEYYAHEKRLLLPYIGNRKFKFELHKSIEAIDNVIKNLRNNQ